MTQKLLGLVFLVLALSSCGKPTSVSSTQALQSVWIIDFVGTDCPTGHHEFTDKTEYCNALLDSTFAGGCAMPDRRGKHVQDCGVPN